MITAKRPDVMRIVYKSQVYKIYDAFPSHKIAEEAAADMRRYPHPNYCYARRYNCKVVVVDLGPDAGRLRYALFIAKGQPRKAKGG